MLLTVCETWTQALRDVGRLSMMFRFSSRLFIEKSIVRLHVVLAILRVSRPPQPPG